VHGGFGIMLDDFLAGVFSAGLLQISARWFT
jgi:phosphatidylglycerophosphatase A